MKDYLIRGTTVDGSIRFACVTTELVEKARKIHDCYPVATAGLGRMLTASSMMGTMLKSDDDKLTIQINGKGPINGILAASDTTGNVRGYVGNGHLDNQVKSSGKLDVGWAVGLDGVATVIRDMGLKEPYIGQVPIVSGEIADDLTVYFANSEQTPTSVGLGVLVEVDGHVSASGGFILQVMPEAEEKHVAAVEENLIHMGQLTDLIHKGYSPEKFIQEILKPFEITIFDKKEISYVCNCEKERIERALISLGEFELTELIEDQGQAEIVCHFCNKKYQFDKSELSELLRKAKS